MDVHTLQRKTACLYADLRNPAAHGVPGYDRRTLDDDYRLSVLWQIATPVWQEANDIPSWIWLPHLERIFMAVDDLGCCDLLAT